MTNSCKADVAASNKNCTDGAKPSKTQTFYAKFISQEVMLKTTENVTYRGKILSIDGYLNVALENVTIVNVKDTMQIAGGAEKYTSAFLKGSNIDYISLI